MPTFTALRLACLVALLSAACSGPEAPARRQTAGGQTGGEVPIGSCDWLHEPKLPLEANALSPLGFSANQVLPAIVQLQDLRFKYQAGGETRLALSASYVGPTQYGETCKDLQLGMSARFVTIDGLFDETLPLTLIATRVDSAGGTVSLERASIHGRYVVSDTRVTQLGLSVAYGSGTAHGAIVEMTPYSEKGEISSPIGSF